MEWMITELNETEMEDIENRLERYDHDHICLTSPIATFCYTLLSDFLALAFALINLQGGNKTV